MPLSVDTGDSFAYVKFVSDGSINAPGFSLSFMASVEGGCGQAPSGSAHLALPTWLRPSHFPHSDLNICIRFFLLCSFFSQCSKGKFQDCKLYSACVASQSINWSIEQYIVFNCTFLQFKETLDEASFARVNQKYNQGKETQYEMNPAAPQIALS